MSRRKAQQWTELDEDAWPETFAYPTTRAWQCDTGHYATYRNVPKLGRHFLELYTPEGLRLCSQGVMSIVVPPPAAAVHRWAEEMMSVYHKLKSTGGRPAWTIADAKSPTPVELPEKVG